MTAIERHKNVLLIKNEPGPKFQLNLERCRALPDYRRWNKKLGGWTARPSPSNVRFIEQVWPDATWSADAEVLRLGAMGSARQAAALTKHRDEVPKNPSITDYSWAGTFKPFVHQRRAFILSRELTNYALLMEQGTGKTKVIIDTGAFLFNKHKLDCMLIVCPNGVKSTWEEEIEAHCPRWLDTDVRVWASSMTPKQRRLLFEWVAHPDPSRLQILIVNVEGQRAPTNKRQCSPSYTLALEFIARRKTLMAVDESTRIKKSSALRTKACWQLGKLVSHRRILTGTPVTQSPLDMYSQFRFLDPDILGFGSYYAFRNHFCMMGGYQGKEVVAYVNMEELQELVRPYSFRVLADECLDLPPRTYQKVIVELSPEQRKHYRSMRDAMVTEHAGEMISVTLALTMYLRLQQIIGGFLPVPRYDELLEREVFDMIPIEGPNPKLVELLNILDDYAGKVVIWSRFRPEMAIIEKALAKKFGADSVAGFHGGVSVDDRTTNRHRFQDMSDPLRFLVGNPQTGGVGVTLTAARLVIYFSNSFNLEDRLQSEKRVNRPGQTGTVTYVDLLADKTLDTTRILLALRSKKGLADLVTGDNWSEWI